MRYVGKKKRYSLLWFWILCLVFLCENISIIKLIFKLCILVMDIVVYSKFVLWFGMKLIFLVVFYFGELCRLWKMLWKLVVMID